MPVMYLLFGLSLVSNDLVVKATTSLHFTARYQVDENAHVVFTRDTLYNT